MRRRCFVALVGSVCMSLFLPMGLLVALPNIFLKKIHRRHDLSRTQYDNLNCSVSLSAEHTHPIVALASFPGSGNTWLRHLLELSTGIYTGSVFHSKILYTNGFIGEYEDYTLGTTLTVKIHGNYMKDFQAAILLIRDPYKSLIAEYNRRMAGKTGTASMSDFFSEGWNQYLNERAPVWETHVLHWLSIEKPLLVIDYLSLKEDTIGEMSKITEFLKTGMTDTRRQCLLKDMSGSFHREGQKSVPDDPFTADMHLQIEGYIANVNDRLKQLHLPPLRREFSVTT
ncbi:sialate:O-sulfotransferase 2-like [Ptychodera flava]|uniref:sialate:O-sulfotransferase 2-like n=1 Tax=Ptychodera flava TaxID=63121 RepID=UPI003969CE8D